MANILFAGEQVTGTGFEIKGFDSFAVNTDKEDGQALYDALIAGGHDVTWMRTSQVARHFPESLEKLQAYDMVILSDVGSNTLLFHPEMLARSIPHPNRLKLLAEYVRQGGGLIMVGGWMSFAGIDGKARYHGTPLEEVLPVTCLPYDDRQECPEGVTPEVVDPTHPVLVGVAVPWPFFLGYNRVIPRPQAKTLLALGSDPLACVWQCNQGRAAVFTSDCSPHWGPRSFLEWPGYPVFWNNLVAWLTTSSQS